MAHRRWLGVALVAAAIVLLGDRLAEAQQQNRLGRQGTLGGMGTIGTATQMSGAGGAFGARNLGSTLAPGNRTFAGGAGGAGVGAQGGFDNSNVGLIGGNERFLRGNRQAGQFVGADTADARFIGATGGTGTGLGSLNLGGNFGPGGLGPQQQRPDQQGQTPTRAQTTIPTRYRVDFTYSAPAATAVATTLQTRLSNIRGLAALGPLDVQMEGRTAILRGEVATDRDRDLAARLALLEAGVSAVRNELTVAQPQAPAAGQN
jgi:hypothetical protein